MIDSGDVRADCVNGVLARGGSEIGWMEEYQGGSEDDRMLLILTETPLTVMTTMLETMKIRPIIR